MIFPGRPSAKVKRSKSPRLSFRILSLLVAVLHVLSVNPVAQAATYTGGVGSGDASAQGGQASAPATLVFSVQPTLVKADQVFDPQPKIEVRSRNGNLVQPGGACTISLSLYNTPGYATLGGTTSKAVVSGVADFKNNDLYINREGRLYTLRATASGLGCTNVTPAISPAFDVLPPEFQVKSELLYNSSTRNYSVNSWLESGGKIISDVWWSCYDIMVSTDSTRSDRHGAGLRTHACSNDV